MQSSKMATRCQKEIAPPIGEKMDFMKNYYDLGGGRRTMDFVRCAKDIIRAMEMSRKVDNQRGGSQVV